MFLAKRFVAGVSLEDALEVLEVLRAEGKRTTLDYLGEDVTDRKGAEDATMTYMNIIKKVDKTGYNVTIKLSQIGLAIDVETALKNLLRILKASKKYDVVVEIDMEGSRYTQDTIDIYLKVLKIYKKIVIAVQSYLYRSERDLKRLVRNKGRIRIVKGTYKEGKKVAFRDKERVNENYVKLMEFCLKKSAFIFVATHDENIIERAKKFIKKKKIKKEKYEFEMLYGIRKDLQDKLVDEGFVVRIYVPYGSDWAGYFYRRIRERKENFIFALKSLFGK